MKEETISQKALRLLSQVPSEDFITSDFSDKIGKCCVVGHYQRLTSANPNDYSTTNCSDKESEYNSDIRILSKEFMRKKYNLPIDIASVNNWGVYNGYKEPVIKDRVIHLLTDMVKEGL